jgi:hypothetical protein
MKSCCAKTKLDTAIEKMKCSDEISASLPNREFMFTPEQVFLWLQEDLSHDEIVELTEALADEYEIEPCKISVDPFVCGCTFILVIDALYVRPVTQ